MRVVCRISKDASRLEEVLGWMKRRMVDVLLGMSLLRCGMYGLLLGQFQLQLSLAQLFRGLAGGVGDITHEPSI